MTRRHILLKRRDAIVGSLAGELALLSRSEQVTDEGDEAQDAEMDDVYSQLVQHECRELDAIEYALARMRSGDYGVCEECGRNIPVVRLQALPYATLCINCQRGLDSPGCQLSSSRHLRTSDNGVDRWRLKAH